MIARRALASLRTRVPSAVVRPLAATSSVRHGSGGTDVDAFTESLKSQLAKAVLQELTPEKLKAHFDLSSTSMHQPEDDIVAQVNAMSLEAEEIFYNSSPAVLYQEALQEKGSAIVSSGALAVSSHAKTGRSPLDKRIVDEPSSTKDVWWGKVNIPLSTSSFMTNRERALDYLNTREKLYVIDGFVGWDPEFRLPVRVIASRAYHALFMQNMLVPPQKSELAEFSNPSKPPFVIYNAGAFPCNRQTVGMTSSTSVSVSFDRSEMVILGTQYAGEMKKGAFTLMNYYMPLQPSRDLPSADRNLPLHASANIGDDNDVSIFFGLSGTGKTTLSADPKRDLIGDDEHVWTTKGVFNMEGGCYAKCVGLTRDKEPEIYDAIRFGAVLENVVYDDSTREVDYYDTSVTENTRLAYPLQFIPNARIPAVVDHHPKNIILLTCDAFGVLPPVSKLTSAQVMYHLISGYTAKVAGTEMGVTEPQATFSPCFGGPFLVHHPFVYAEILAAKLEKYKADAWLINTGWVGGEYGTGDRCSLKYTRAIIDAVHDGTLGGLPDDQWEAMPIFGLLVPKGDVNGVPKDVLTPKLAWAKNGLDGKAFDATAGKLADLFNKNFNEYADRCTKDVLAAAPK